MALNPLKLRRRATKKAKAMLLNARKSGALKTPRGVKIDTVNRKRDAKGRFA